MKTRLKAAGRAFVAAITSPQAVKLEKSLAVLVITRVLLAIGATTGLVELVKALVS